MPSIKLDDVVIKDRQRKEVDADYISGLARSISSYGLLNPIVLTDKDELVAGFCRFMAHRLLERVEIEYTRKSDLSEIRKKELELEENVRRKDLEYWEKAQAVEEIHELKKQEEGDSWTYDKTAELIGQDRSTMHHNLTIAREMKKDPNLPKRAKTLTSAVSQVRRRKDLEGRRQMVALKEEGIIPTYSAEIREGDAHKLIQELEDGSVDAIITNPPFGVGLKFDEVPAYASSSDEEEVVVDLMLELIPEWYRVLKEGGWVVSYFATRKVTSSNFAYKLYKELQGTELEGLALRALGLAGWLSEAGFTVDWLPSPWVKPNKSQGTMRDPNKSLIPDYETAIFGRKGDAQLLEAGHQSTFTYDTPKPSERVHKLQMPVDLTSELVSMVCVSGETVLDPFAGSGSVGLGALENRCHFIGFEIDPDNCQNGNLLLKEHQFPREDGGDEG